MVMGLTPNILLGRIACSQTLDMLSVDLLSVVHNFLKGCECLYIYIVWKCDIVKVMSDKAWINTLVILLEI